MKIWHKSGAFVGINKCGWRSLNSPWITLWLIRPSKLAKDFIINASKKEENCSRGSIEEQKNFLGLAAISIIENAENYYGEKVDLTEETG